MLSMHQQRSKTQHTVGMKDCHQPMHSPPPIGPEPLFLSRKEVDALYDTLQILQRILMDLEIEYIPIRSTLLGAVRSKSILFHEKRGIALGIFDHDGSSYARLKKHLTLDPSEANPQQSHHEHYYLLGQEGIQYQERGESSCDRITSEAAPRIGIDLHVLCRYDSRPDLMHKVLPQRRPHNNDHEDDAAVRRTMDSSIPDSAFPLYHYDNEKAIRHAPRDYFTTTEVRPLASTAFGALELPCPGDCIGPLDRFYGPDWSTRYSSNTTAGISQPLLEEHYHPTQHSLPDRRIWSDHSKRVLEQTIDLYREDQAEEEEPTFGSSSGGGGMARTHSLFSLGGGGNSSMTRRTSPLSVTNLDEIDNKRHNNIHNESSNTATSTPLPQPTKWFGADVRRHIGEGPPVFDKDLRAVMEPHLRKARQKREECRAATDLMVDASIAGSVGVPYTALRDERRFLFDEHSHPLHQILADTLGVTDLSQLHTLDVQDKRQLLAPLLTKEGRYKFQECYDHFVTSFCIPLLHSLAITKKQFHSQAATTPSSANTGITYRYQAFPCLRVVRPGEFSIGPHCDTAYGHSIGNLNFHIPLTPVSGTNSLFIESFPGKEDWHPLTTKSPGLGFLFDGARCLHFTLENTTDTTRVSLDFRIAIYSNNSNNSLCSKELLADRFSNAGPGYYDEAHVDGSSPGAALVVKKRGNHSLLTPDRRVGYPFK